MSVARSLALSLCLAVGAAAQEKAVPTVTFESGDYVLTFDGDRFWTIWDLSYKGVQILSGIRGAHNGTVLSCQPEGWIGTGHGLEEVIEMSVQVGPKKEKFQADRKYRGKKVTLTKKSSLRIYELLATVELTPEGIEETNKYTVKEERPINFVYGFMHSFAQNMSEWAAQPMEGETTSGKFVDDKKNLLLKPILWAAVFDPAKKVGIVCRFPEKYVAGSNTFFWDREHDNKLYFQLKPKVGEEFECRANLRAFEAKKGDWIAEAKKTAAGLPK